VNDLGLAKWQPHRIALVYRIHQLKNVERIPKSRTSGSKSPIADIVAVDSMAQKETTSLGASSSNHPRIGSEKCMNPHI
jgi:hypothetical protein